MRRYLPIALAILVALIVISRISTADSTRTTAHAAGEPTPAPRQPAGAVNPDHHGNPDHDDDHGAADRLSLASIPRRSDRHRPGVRARRTRRGRRGANRADDL